LGLNKDWNLKFIEKKNTDINGYYFNSLEIFDYVYTFLNKYSFKVLNTKLYYNRNNIKLYVVFYSSNIVLRQLNTKISEATFLVKSKLNSLLITFNAQVLRFKYYIKLRHLKQVYQYIRNKDWFFNKTFVINYVFCRLSIFKFICFVKYKYINLKYNFLLNNFFSKFLISLSRFFSNKACILIVFKQLIKNMNFRVVQNRSKHLLTFNLLKIRKFDKLPYFKSILNLLYYCFILVDKVTVLSYILSSKLPNIKEIKNVNTFLKFVENALKYFLIKLNIVKGLKLILKGNLTKNKRATKAIIIIGNVINNSKINNNLSFNQTTCFTAKGTLGIKTYIKN
jgi:hypothetical protein